MGEARRRAEAAASGDGDRAFLREAERRQGEARRELDSDGMVRSTTLEAVNIEEALAYPTHGRLVAYVLKVAAAVARGEPSSHGAAACMTCGTSWTPGFMPVVAVIGTRFGKPCANLVCAACTEVGQARFMAERLLPLLRSQGELDGRLVRAAPGGSA